MHSNAVAGPSSAHSLLPHYSSSPSPPPDSDSPALPLLRPNTPPRPLSPPPLLFLPPPAPPPPKQHLKSTQDLLARFHLHPAYDRYVRPFVTPGDDPPLPNDPNATVDTPSRGGMDAGLAGHTVSGPSAIVTSKPDKGKGKEREPTVGVGTPGADGLDAADAEDDDPLGGGGKGEKKKKNSYKHLIKGAPGKHSFKKDDYLTTTMLQPPKQRLRIHHFDQRTQQDAFTVSSTGIVGWNVHSLIQESAQAREDRRRKKEMKRKAKEDAERAATLQAQQPIGSATPKPQGQKSAASTPLPSAAARIGTPSSVLTPGHPPIQAPIPTTASGVRRISGANATGKPVGTPRPGVGTPRPGSATTANSATVAASTTVVSSGGPGGAASRPTSTIPRPGSTVPRPVSAVPRPGSGVSAKPPVMVQQQSIPPTQLRPSTPMDVDQQRGKKREREETNGNGVLHGNGVPMANGNGNANANVNGVPNGTGYYQHPQLAQQHGGMMQSKQGMINAKAGTGNIRPRPVKKQRMDVQGQARDVSAPVQQQPTPQGV